MPKATKKGVGKPAKSTITRWFRECRKYPFVLSVKIFYGRKPQEAFKARNEIEKKISKLGKWVGSGGDVGPGAKGCDIQVDFISEAKRTDAKAIAAGIIRKYGLQGQFRQSFLTLKDCREMYGHYGYELKDPVFAVATVTKPYRKMNKELTKALRTVERLKPALMYPEG